MNLPILCSPLPLKETDKKKLMENSFFSFFGNPRVTSTDIVL